MRRTATSTTAAGSGGVGVFVVDDDDGEEEERAGLFRNDDDDDDDVKPGGVPSREQQERRPLELVTGDDEEEYNEADYYDSYTTRTRRRNPRAVVVDTVTVFFFHWQEDPSALLLPSSFVTLFLVVPLLAHCALYTIYYRWLGRLWVILPILLHLVLSLSSTQLQLRRCLLLQSPPPPPPTTTTTNHHHHDKHPPSSSSSCFVVAWTSFASLVDIILFVFVYRKIWQTVMEDLLTEVDGTIVLEWTNDYRALQMYSAVGIVIAIIRLCFGSLTVVARLLSSCFNKSIKDNPRHHSHPIREDDDDDEEAEEVHQQNIITTPTPATGRRRVTIVMILNILILCYWIVLIPLLIICILSALGTHLRKRPALHFSHNGNNGDPTTSTCNAMDPTECWLPFPSFEQHMERDSDTATGWKVNLKGQNLPPMRSVNDMIHPTKMDMAFLNELDGFSTMGPLLFYMDGLKEAHEAVKAADKTASSSGGGGREQQLHGHDVAISITSKSKTLLVNVNTSTLVAHSSEIDYLDPMNPLVMVFPAQPLSHNQHYALAVINVTDTKGVALAPTLGLTTLLQLSQSTETTTTTTGTFPTSVGGDNGDNTKDDERFDRFTEHVLPALRKAAPWLTFPLQSPASASSAFPDGIQLLFDFVTVSETSQLGPVRAVRDATLQYVSSPQYYWKEHVRVNGVVEGNCRGTGSVTARTIHAEIDVPWFLTGYGNGHRGATLDMNVVRSGQPTTIGAAKFIVHVPCSVRAAATTDDMGEDKKKGKPIRAIMEFGHGLFGHRGESWDDFLQKMANDEGYIIMAMDWRGMCKYDLLVVIRTLLGQPSLFQAVRDNLIQGYANKFALQHFSQYGMLSMDWFEFTTTTSAYGDGRKKQKRMVAPTLNNKPPVAVFYGISQGGILGAGYSALSGTTGLIKRAILGVPGTPFALIMTRSLDFAGYDTLLQFNFYNNRHVRSFLAIIQMAWDSVEGSGVLATPISEKPIPPILIQAGLGDPVVPTIAAEALARGLNASVLPNHPRNIWGIPEALAADETQSGPYTTLTELLYEKEYASLPVDDEFANGPNSVHVCVRHDHALIRQIKEYVNTGRVIDICINDDDGCRRARSAC